MADYISTLTGAQMDAALTDMAQHDSEAWAVGERDGIVVGSGDATYHNNAKYYAEQASNYISGDISGAVRWDIAQSLSDANKTQARGNIGAAPLASPDLTGTPTAPTAATDTNTTQLATTAFVIAEIKSYLNRINKVNAANTSYTTYMARGEALASTETTPSVNGAICWLYE